MEVSKFITVEYKSILTEHYILNIMGKYILFHYLNYYML